MAHLTRLIRFYYINQEIFTRRVSRLMILPVKLTEHSYVTVMMVLSHVCYSPTSTGRAVMQGCNLNFSFVLEEGAKT